MRSSQTLVEVLDPNHWNGYALLDSGNFLKLERFGNYVISRPEPQALWEPSLSKSEWDRITHASFTRDKVNPEKGLWKVKNMPEKWEMRLQSEYFDLHFKLSLTGFKHVGLFPEQALNWEYVRKTLLKLPANPSVLNLFAYTGGASITASVCGAKVVHVDSVKNVITWGNENARLNAIDNIRWVVEDALKFAKREVTRGKKYQGIILDPPAYGRGPDGEKWVLEEHLREMLQCVTQLLEEKGFILLNLYSMGLSPLIGQTLFEKLLPNTGNCSLGELAIADPRNFLLPLGTYVRYERF